MVGKYLERYGLSINRYEVPGVVEEFVERVAEYSGVDQEYVSILAGSEAFFTTIPWYLVKHGYRFIYCSPTFVPAINDLMVWGIETIDVPLDDNYRVVLDKVLETGDRPSILYLVNPNNPTGNIVIDCRDLAGLVETYGLVVVDEAYYEYCDMTCIDLVKRYNNIVFLRTFSKAFCLAGARLGYVLGDPSTLKELFRARRRYDVPLTSIIYGLGAINDLDYMRNVVHETIKIRRETVEKLREIDNVYVHDTCTNFILVGIEGFDSKSLKNTLYEKGVEVKELDGRLNKYVRVSIGTREEMMFFIDLVEELAS